MSGVEYNVAAILSGKDEGLERKLHATAAASDKANRALEGAKSVATAAAGAIGKAGEIAGGAIDRIVSFGAKGVAALGAAGVAGALWAAKVGILDVNASLEDTSIGFTTLFHTIGGSSMEEALGQAREIMGDIRKDAKELPGEFGDFVGMAQTLTAPLLNAGKGLQDIRNLTRDTVVVAASLGIRYDQASREMAMLLEGHAGGHNVLGTRLGITAHTQIKGQDFNQAGMADRISFITGKLQPAKDSLDLFSKSWAGLTSTLSDTGKQALGTATAGLFGRAKEDMARLVYWAGQHEDQIQRIAHNVGVKLVQGYDLVAEKVEWVVDNWDLITDKADHYVERVKAGLAVIEPYARRVYGFLAHEMENPERAGKHLLEARIGAGIASHAPGMLGAGLQFGNMFRGAGGTAEAVEQGVTKALAKGGGGLFGGPGALESSMVTNPLLADTLGGGAATGAAGLGAASVAFIALAVAAAVAVAAIDDVGGTVETWTNLGKDSLQTLGDLWEQVAGKGTLLRDAFGFLGAVATQVADNAIRPLLNTLDGLTWALDWMNTGWNAVKFAIHPFGEETEKLAGNLDLAREAADYASIALTGLISPLGALRKLAIKLGILSEDAFAGVADEKIDHPTDTPSTMSILGVQAPVSNPEAGKKPTTKAPVVDARGSHITLQLNTKDSDPDRIIRKVFTRIGDVLAKPITAPYAPAPSGY